MCLCSHQLGFGFCEIRAGGFSLAFRPNACWRGLAELESENQQLMSHTPGRPLEGVGGWITGVAEWGPICAILLCGVIQRASDSVPGV